MGARSPARRAFDAARLSRRGNFEVVALLEVVNQPGLLRLPAKTRAYLKAVAELTGGKLAIASIGPGREQTIFVK